MFNKDNFDLNNLNMNGIDNLNMDGIGSLIMMVGTVASLVFTASLFSNFINIINANRVRPIDLTRVQQGLPTDVSVNPNEITDPELLRHLGVREGENIHFALESNEHSQYLDL